MEWIKRNLLFVIGAAVALVMMAGAGFFLYTQIQENDTVDRTLNDQIAELRRIQEMDPHPGTPELDNVGEIKKDEQRIKQFANQAKADFVSIPPYPSQDERTFKQMLESVINELERGAVNSAVAYPEGFSFGFTVPRRGRQFAPGSVDIWVYQLAEIKALFNVLFQAKINRIDTMQRVPLARDDQNQSLGANDYVQLLPQTNNMIIRTPYQLSFYGFSGQLASVLEGMVRSSNCFIIKNITVQQAPDMGPAFEIPVPGAPPTQFGASPAFQPQQREPSAEAQMRSRYGLNRSGTRPMTAPAPVTPLFMPGVARAPTNTPPTTLFSEKLLRITLLLDVVRLKPTK